MPVYLWEGKTAKGTLQKGENEAPSEQVLRQRLKGQNVKVLKIKKTKRYP